MGTPNRIPCTDSCMTIQNIEPHNADCLRALNTKRSPAVKAWWGGGGRHASDAAVPCRQATCPTSLPPQAPAASPATVVGLRGGPGPVDTLLQNRSALDWTLEAGWEMGKAPGGRGVAAAMLSLTTC